MRIDPGPAAKAAPEPLSSHDVSSDVLTADEAARELRVPLRTLYDRADKGEIPHFRVGRRRQFLRETIMAIKGQGRMRPIQPPVDDI